MTTAALIVLIEEAISLGNTALDLMEEVCEEKRPPTKGTTSIFDKIGSEFPDCEDLLCQYINLPRDWTDPALEDMYQTCHSVLRHLIAASVSLDQFHDTLQDSRDPFDTMILYGAIHSGFNLLQCSLNRHLRHLEHLYKAYNSDLAAN